MTAWLFAFFLVFGVPLWSEAAIFSFISELFGRAGGESAAVVSPNSQNMALLEAALNPDPSPAKGGGDITVVGGTALLPEYGPDGTLADIASEGGGSDAISTYVVRRGDTISGIAQMFGVSINTIIWNNDIQGGLIREGEKLIILPITGVQHTVKQGDTLRSVVARYKGDLREVLKFNNLSENDPLTVGQVIIIPDGEVGAPRYYLPAAPLRGGGPDYAGYYMQPLLGGYRTQGLHGYNAVDLANAYGAPIFAAAAGTVIINRDSGWNGGYGRYIVIQHDNGTQTLYAHNSQNIVYEGQVVSRGQVIGFIGSSGRVTGPHLHFEIRGARNPF